MLRNLHTNQTQGNLYRFSHWFTQAFWLRCCLYPYNCKFCSLLLDFIA